MWNYLGWDGLSTVTGEIHEPRRTYPLALVIMIPAITLVYVLPVLAGMAGGTDWQAWTAGYFPVVAGNLAGAWLKAADDVRRPDLSDRPVLGAAACRYRGSRSWWPATTTSRSS